LIVDSAFVDYKQPVELENGTHNNLSDHFGITAKISVGNSARIDSQKARENFAEAVNELRKELKNLRHRFSIILVVISRKWLNRTN